MRRPPYRLVPDAVSKDTVACLEDLLSKARNGELIGIAFAAAFKTRAYITDTAGECHRNPTWARGLVAALDDHLAGRVRGAPD